MFKLLRYVFIPSTILTKCIKSSIIFVHSVHSLLIVAFLAQQRVSYEMNCRFKEFKYYGPFGKHYTCQALKFNSNCNIRDIASFSGGHKNWRNSDDVTQIYIDHQNSECLPQNLPNIFKNILVLCVRSCKVDRLFASDLEGLGDLRVLDLGWNKIETIPAQFFDSTPKIEQISIRANRVKHVGIDILQLNRLTDMYMDGNICVKMIARTAARLQLLQGRMRSDCRMPYAECPVCPVCPGSGRYEGLHIFFGNMGLSIFLLPRQQGLRMGNF